MNKFIVCFLAIMTLNRFAAGAQYINDLQGKPYMEHSYTEVDGSAYLIANWAAGTVTFVNGKTITAPIKYDLVRDELLFQNKGDSAAMSFVEPVKGFGFTNAAIEESNIIPPVFSSGFPAVDSQTPASFYQVIADGKTKLLRYYKKTIRTDKAFNSATSTKTFVLINLYYVFINNQITKIKPGQKTILAALNDKAGQLQTYMKSNTVNYKNDADLAKLFTYYNSL